MDASVSIQRPRPQNLTVGLGGNFSDFKSFTASLKPSSSSDWNTSYRSVTSATLKTESIVDHENKASPNKADREFELREEIAALKMKFGLTSEKKSSSHKGQSSKAASLNPSPCLEHEVVVVEYDIREKAVAKSDHSVEIIHDRIHSLTRELEESTKLITEKEREVDQLKTRLRENLEKIQIQESDLAHEREKNVHLENSLKETCERLSSNLQQREQEIATLRSTVEQLKEEHERSMAHLRAEEEHRVHHSEETIRRLEEKVGSLEAELGHHHRNGEIIHEKEREISHLKHQIEEHEREIERVREHNRNLEEQIRNSTAHAEESARRAEERLQSETSQLRDIITRLEGEIQDYRDIKARLETSVSDREELVRKQISLEEELALARRSLEEAGNASQNHLEEVNGRFGSLQEELEKERQFNQQLISEKDQEIERLHGELRKIIDEKFAETQEKMKVIGERDSLQISLEKKNAEVETLFFEKEEISRQLEAEIQRKVTEFNDQKYELESFRTKYEELNQETSCVRSTLGEKEARIHSLEIEVRCLAQEQEQSQKVFQQIHEAKVLINEFNEKFEKSAESELLTALQILLEESRKSQEALKQESLKVKELEDEVRRAKENSSQNHDDLTSQIRHLESEKTTLSQDLTQVNQRLETLEKEHEKISYLEKEKYDLQRSLDETRDLLQKSVSDTETLRFELSQTIQRLETEKQGLVGQVEEKEERIRAALVDVQAKEIEIEQLKETFDKERATLLEEVNGAKDTAISLNDIKEENLNLRDTLKSIDEEKLRLHEKIHEYTEKLEFSLKEITELQAQTEQQAIELTEIKEASRQQIVEFEAKMAAKDQYIQALISDVNQMKEFIVDRHGESVFEKDGLDENKEVQEENEPREETEAREQAQEEVIEAKEGSKKIVVVIEEPYYRNPPYRGWYEDNYRPAFERRRSTRNFRYWRDEPKIIYEPKNSNQETQVQTQEREEEYVPRYQRRSPSRGARKEIVRESKIEVQKEMKQEVTKFDPSKEKKAREEDPVYKQLEKMIKELNEKLLGSEKRAKKLVEEKMIEAEIAQQKREEGFMTEIEKLKDEKKQLLKKIDDIQWEKAYEFNEKMKAEKLSALKVVEVENKGKQQNQTALEASKKKKKK